METSMEAHRSTCMERNSSSRLEENMGTGAYQGRHSRRETLRKRRTRLGIHVTRSLEEESRLESPLEEDLENREETNLGAIQEVDMEGRMETDLEDGKETNLGALKETGVEG